MVFAYMIGKYSLRWKFYRVTARICGAENWRGIREVVNPGKDAKLREVAGRHGIEGEKFVTVGRRVIRVFPLLP